MRIVWILGVLISICSTSSGQLPFELAPEELGNAEADFIDFVLSNPDLLFNAGLDGETSTTETSKPQTTTPIPTTPNPKGTEQPPTRGENEGSSTGNKDSTHGLLVENGMVRDPVTGKVTHVIDIHDGGLLEVIESEITGGHVIDSHTGELILLSEIGDMLEKAPKVESVTPVTVTLASGGSTTDKPGVNHSEHNPPKPSTTPARETSQSGSTPQKEIINGVIRDPITGQITHIVDPHDGAHLEVIDSPIFGGHVFDPHSGDLIIAEDHALLHGTVDVQPQTSNGEQVQGTDSPTLDTTTSKSITTTKEVSTTTTTVATPSTIEATTTTTAPKITTREPRTTPKIIAAMTTETNTTTLETSRTTTTPEEKTTTHIPTTTKALVDNTLNIITTPAKVEISTETNPTTQPLHLDSVNSPDFIQHGVYVNRFTPSPSGSSSVEKPEPGTQRRKFGTMKGIYSVLDKYKSEYLKRRKDTEDNNGNSTNSPNLNTVLKWIERRKNLFKQVLQEKKHIEEEKKQNPQKPFQVLDLETYFPSLKRNKFGGLEARKKWIGTTEGSTSKSSGDNSATTATSGGSTATKTLSGGNSATDSTRSGSVQSRVNRWKNPFIKNSLKGRTNGLLNTDRRNGFQRLMATKLENERKQAIKENQQVIATPSSVQDSSILQTTTEIPQTTMVNNRRKKFNNFFRNRKTQFSRRSVNSKDTMNENGNKENSVGNYFKSLKEKVNENHAGAGQRNQTPETYVSGLARRINNKIVARNPQNVQLRKDKWDKSYLAEQIKI